MSKHGTNDFHSDAYWFGPFDALGARGYFNHETSAAGQVAAEDSHSRNTFGVSAGGPPRHDRTFWFANYDGERFSTTLTNTSIVPTQAFQDRHFHVQWPVHRCQQTRFTKQHLWVATGPDDAKGLGARQTKRRY